MKHQLYAFMLDRTAVDRQVEARRRAGTLMIFKLGQAADEFAMVERQAFLQHVELWCDLGLPTTTTTTTTTTTSSSSITTSTTTIPSSGGEDRLTAAAIAARYIEFLFERRRSSVSVDRATLESAGLGSEVQLRTLIRQGLLTLRRAGSYWAAIPNAGAFMRELRCGREELLRAIKRSKYKEQPESTLAGRRLRTSALGAPYHLADIIGADIVAVTRTTTGALLRIRSEDEE